MPEWIADIWSQVYEVLKFLVEAGILTIGIYQVYKLFHATRGARILLGLLIVLVSLAILIVVFRLNVLHFLITRMLAPGLVIGFMVIFQPELRTGLAKLGSHPMLLPFIKERSDDFFDEFCQAVQALSKQRIGALFAFERSITLKPQIETGVELDARFSKELSKTLFLNMKESGSNQLNSLHDGGIVIDGQRIVAAACIFPVSQRTLEDRSIGLRHRAALGLAEETDAVVVVVSEENGHVSIVYKDQFYRNLTPEAFREKLDMLLYHAEEQNEEAGKFFRDKEIKAEMRSLFHRIFVRNFVPKFLSFLLSVALCVLIDYSINNETPTHTGKPGIMNLGHDKND